MTDQTGNPPITPDLDVKTLLEAYPALEQTLFELAPAFKKLRTPALRQTVARLTSLRQVAGGTEIALGELISKLRVAAGVEAEWEEGSAAAERPEWLEQCGSIETLDAREEIESGGHPLPRVMAAIDKLERGRAFAIVTPFVPTPMVNMVQQKGFKAWSEQKGPAHFITYFARA
jgi:uncharacterized protein (DUF2249 family)